MKQLGDILEKKKRYFVIEDMQGHSKAILELTGPVMSCDRFKVACGCDCDCLDHELFSCKVVATSKLGSRFYKVGSVFETCVFRIWTAMDLENLHEVASDVKKEDLVPLLLRMEYLDQDFSTQEEIKNGQ